MQTFLVYPKKGKPFPVTCEKFEQNGQEFVLFDSAERPSKEAFLSFDDVAAIVPEKPRWADCGFLPLHVVLRKHDEPIPVHANYFEIAAPVVKFYCRQYDSDPWFEMPEIYVASSEVVALFPSEGLERKRKRSIKGFPSTDFK